MSGTPPRETAVQCERVDRLGSALTYLVTTVRLVIEDGQITDDEPALLEQAIAGTTRTFRPVEVGADQIDTGARMLQLIAGTMAITPWTERQLREIAEDRAWTVLKGGAEDEPEVA